MFDLQNRSLMKNKSILLNKNSRSHVSNANKSMNYLGEERELEYYATEGFGDDYEEFPIQNTSLVQLQERLD